MMLYVLIVAGASLLLLMAMAVAQHDPFDDARIFNSPFPQPIPVKIWLTPPRLR